MTPPHQKKSRRGRMRDYAGGVGPSELPKLWSRDWQRAYAILTREQSEPEPTERGQRLWFRVKTLFFALSYKLTPPRRLLFALCLLLAFLGCQVSDIQIGDRTIELSQMPTFYLASIAGLIFLLILELADRILVRDELEVARELQHELLPRQAPPVEGYRFAFSYRSANTVGGDYYDFLPLPDGRLALVTADASGHGIAAAMLMAVGQAVLRLAIDTDPAPLPVANMMNKALAGTGGPRAFMTLFYGVLTPADGHFEYVCAGHPFALLRRPDGSIEKLGAGSFPLGLRPQLTLSPATATIGAGDLLVLYTDGIPEAIGASGSAYGFDRLQRQVEAGGTPQQVHDRVLADLAGFEGDEALLDDRSLVVIGRAG
jgi:hypothetical protein